MFGKKDQVTLKEDSSILFNYLITIANKEQDLFSYYRDQLVSIFGHIVFTKESLLHFLLQDYKKRTSKLEPGDFEKTTKNSST